MGDVLLERLWETFCSPLRFTACGVFGAALLKNFKQVFDCFGTFARVLHSFVRLQIKVLHNPAPAF